MLSGKSASDAADDARLELTLVVMVPSWFLSNTVKASLNVANSSGVSECMILLRSDSEKVVMIAEGRRTQFLSSVLKLNSLLLFLSCDGGFFQLLLLPPFPSAATVEVRQTEAPYTRTHPPLLRLLSPSFSQPIQKERKRKANGGTNGEPLFTITVCSLSFSPTSNTEADSKWEKII